MSYFANDFSTTDESEQAGMNEFIWMTKIKALDMSLSAMTDWRDKEFQAHIKSRSAECSTHNFCAFNVDQLAVITQSSNAQMADWCLSTDMPQIPPGLALSQDFAELTYTKRQDRLVDENLASILYSVGFSVPAEWADEFDDWYEKEHLPMIYPCQHWAMTKRYRIIQSDQGSTTTHLALHYLTDASGLDAPELKAARLTPWRNKLVKQPWFTQSEKWIYFRQRTTT